MKWLFRFLWLTAWCVWLWLGFGLYRELSRDLGPVVCRLPLTPTEKFVDFLHGAPSVITKDYDSSHVRPVFRRRSAATGEIEFELTPDGRDSDRWTFTVSARHGFVIGCEESLPERSETTIRVQRRGDSCGEVRLFDLRTGQRRDVRDLGALAAAMETRPWAMFIRDVAGGKRAVVLDLQTGERLYEKTFTSGFVDDGWPHFVGGGCFVCRIPNGKDGAIDVLYSVASPGLTWTIPEKASFVSVSDDGKIAWYEAEPGRVCKLEVFSLIGRGLVISHVPVILPRTAYSIEFSSDGRCVLSPGTGALIDFESGMALWSGAGNELVRLVIPSGRFEVEETWPPGGIFPWTFNTFALRSMRDGSLVSRTWHSTMYWPNDDYSLIQVDGMVYGLPPRVNWLLLALFQATLASPIIVLWAAIRRWWKRSPSRKESTP